MSLGYIGSKHTVYDVYPLRNKKVLLLVDPQNILGETSDFRATIATIAYLLQRQAMIVIASSFGPLSGITLNLSKKEREGALDAFKRESGMGYTNFFSTLSPAAKVEVLHSIIGDHDQSKAAANTGKTSLFASLTNAQKRKALETFYSKKEFLPCSTSVFVEHLNFHFPEVNISFAPDCLRAPIEQLNAGEICVLENLRFYHNEMSPDAEDRAAFAEVLAAGIDIFVNDSFGIAHGVFASSVEIPKLLQHGAAGHSMDRELAFYSKFLNHPGHPLAVVIAGSNIPGKLQLIRSLIGRVDKIFVAGAVALPFLVAKGLPCGKNYPVDQEPTVRDTMQVGGNSMLAASSSILRDPRTTMSGTFSNEIPCSQYARELIDLCERYDVELNLPIDHVVLPDPDSPTTMAVQVESTAIPGRLYAMDCGRNTINLFARRLRECRTVCWTGTFGWASKGYCDGTKMFAEVLSKMDIISIVGGRYTAQLVHEAGVAASLMHVSSGGLSCLQVLKGSALPGVLALSDAAPVVESHTSLSVHQLLRNLPLFMGCNSHQLKGAAKKFVRRVHSRGDYIICSGERHGFLVVVAQGGLVARLMDDYGSSPGRYVAKGHTIGMYEFITQAPALETVRAALPETVTYQLSSSALSELLNSHPDLAAQLFQNTSEPLRVIANDDYQQQRSVAAVVQRSTARTRVPLLPCVGSGMWKDILQDVLGILVFQKLSMQYTPLVDVDTYYNDSVGNFVGRTMVGVQKHVGLPYVIASALARNVVYHYLVGTGKVQTWLASVAGAAVTAPLRILSYGIPYFDMNFKLMIDEALLSAVASVAPLAAYGASLAIEKRVERRRKQKMSTLNQLAAMAVVKMLLGLVVFPIVYQRNFVYTQPSASRFWNQDAFRAYQLKQVLSLFLRFIVNESFKLVSA